MSTYNISFFRETRNIFIIWILFLDFYEVLVPGQVNWNFLLVLREMGQVGQAGMVFVCVRVEVLRPSRSKGVMSSMARLPNHMFTEQA